MNRFSNNGLPAENMPPRALLVVTDGLGYDPEKVRMIARRIIDALRPSTRRTLTEFAGRYADNERDFLSVVRLAVIPITAEGISPALTWAHAERIISNVRDLKLRLGAEGFMDEIAEVRRRIAREQRYVPWIAEDPEWSEIVDRNLTVPTEASGVWVGYEDVDPPVQGNSETGHQQIGNLALAPQIPLQISRSIDDGTFYENAKMLNAIDGALASGGNVNFCFLLSGIRGSDGRVHSAWNHLEAFCELLFTKIGVPPSKVRMQAILDGRDAPAHGSLEIDGIEGGYLGELRRLLSRYDAIESLAWVIGRSLSMDRDYREENARCDYMLMTRGEGQTVTSIDDVAAIVSDTHAAGMTDADVPPIALNHGNRGVATIEPGDAFINLNFRSDRQRSKTATLCGAKDYLEREASSRSRTWKLDWLRDDLNLDICTIAEYDAEFEERYGVKVAYPITPHELNFLSNWDTLKSKNDRYMLVAESVKASHMGYFVRGRREASQGSSAEDRHIFASDAVTSDSDFYLNPPMQTEKIARTVSDAMSDGKHTLIMCNLAAPDMVGHLLPTRFDASIESYRHTVATLMRLSIQAERNGYAMVVTSDHGNIENDAPTHTTNPVLTTVIPAAGRATPRDDTAYYSATLFDISHTLARLIGVDRQAIDDLIATHRAGLSDEFIGKSIIA